MNCRNPRSSRNRIRINYSKSSENIKRRSESWSSKERKLSTQSNVGLLYHYCMISLC